MGARGEDFLFRGSECQQAQTGIRGFELVNHDVPRLPQRIKPHGRCDPGRDA